MQTPSSIGCFDVNALLNRLVAMRIDGVVFVSMGYGTMGQRSFGMVYGTDSPGMCGGVAAGMGQVCVVRGEIFSLVRAR